MGLVRFWIRKEREGEREKKTRFCRFWETAENPWRGKKNSRDFEVCHRAEYCVWLQHRMSFFFYTLLWRLFEFINVFYCNILIIASVCPNCSSLQLEGKATDLQKGSFPSGVVTLQEKQWKKINVARLSFFYIYFLLLLKAEKKWHLNAIKCNDKKTKKPSIGPL